MSPSAIAVAVLVGWVASAVVAALLWRRPAFRLLPVLYGLVVGAFIVITFDHTSSRTLADTVAGLVVGGVLWFALWTEVRFNRRPSSTEN